MTNSLIFYLKLGRSVIRVLTNRPKRHHWPLGEQLDSMSSSEGSQNDSVASRSMIGLNGQVITLNFCDARVSNANALNDPPAKKAKLDVEAAFPEASFSKLPVAKTIMSDASVKVVKSQDSQGQLVHYKQEMAFAFLTRKIEDNRGISVMVPTRAGIKITRSRKSDRSQKGFTTTIEYILLGGKLKTPSMEPPGYHVRMPGSHLSKQNHVSLEDFKEREADQYHVINATDFCFNRNTKDCIKCDTHGLVGIVFVEEECIPSTETILVVLAPMKDEDKRYFVTTWNKWWKFGWDFNLYYEDPACRMMTRSVADIYKCLRKHDFSAIMNKLPQSIHFQGDKIPIDANPSGIVHITGYRPCLWICKNISVRIQNHARLMQGANIFLGRTADTPEPIWDNTSVPAEFDVPAAKTNPPPESTLASRSAPAERTTSNASATNTNNTNKYYNFLWTPPMLDHLIKTEQHTLDSHKKSAEDLAQKIFKDDQDSKLRNDAIVKKRNDLDQLDFQISQLQGQLRMMQQAYDRELKDYTNLSSKYQAQRQQDYNTYLQHQTTVKRLEEEVRRAKEAMEFKTQKSKSTGSNPLLSTQITERSVEHS